MLSETELAQFTTAGVATIDTPLSGVQLAAASATLGALMPLPEASQPPRFRVGQACSFFDQPLLDILQEPFFEEVAKQALHAEQVEFFQTAIVTTYPQPGAAFSFDQHVDIQYCLSDLRATPRRMVCSFFLWLTEVNERRAPLMFRPGSHWLIAAERERDEVLRRQPPCVAGVSLAQLPALPYAEPVPLLARRGQVSVLTTAAVHGASVNIDTEPRQAMIITFTAAGVQIGLPEGQAALKRQYDADLRPRLRPDRVHIVPMP
ncbi:MAG: phytanoyl-CoA dioxygenase family protein [Candidatus Latescibacteria bacterium]|nr:phytanoyl-CoA dioxygenase family protein [Candidatus Latescibacterota bacterium]